MIEGIYTRPVETTLASDSTLSLASRQQQEQRGDRQPGTRSTSFGDTLTLSPEAQQQLNKVQQPSREVRTQEQAQTASTPLAPLSAGGDGNRNTGFLHSAMEVQLRGDKVAALYQAQRDKFIPPTALAPNGTGIAYTV